MLSPCVRGATQQPDLRFAQREAARDDARAAYICDAAYGRAAAG